MTRPIRRPVAALITAIVVAACSGGGTAVPPGQPGATTPRATLGALAPTPTDAPLPGNSFRPSGAKVRVVNLYRGAGKLDPIDVYGDFNARGKPLLTIPYGTATDYFDPGILDDQGEAHLSFYRPDKHGFNDAVMDQSETLKGTEIIDMVLGTGESADSNGEFLGSLAVQFENGTAFPLPTPPAGQALLIVNAIELSKLPPPAADYLYISLGKECLKAYDADQFTGAQPFGPHNQSDFFIPEGPQTVSFFTADTCSGTSPYPRTDLNLAAGQRAMLVVYSPDDKQLKTVLLPFQP